MTFTKEPAGSDIALTFEDVPAGTTAGIFAPSVKPAVPTVEPGARAPHAIPPVPPLPPYLQEIVNSAATSSPFYQPEAMAPAAATSKANVHPAPSPFDSPAGATFSAAPESQKDIASPPAGPVGNQLQVLRELQQVSAKGSALSESGGSKEELANILEGFARVIRSGNTDVFADASFKDHTGEIMQLKELLLEAQETIIGLLNDRVFDRAKLAKLESEARLMPDLQAQATRAMGLAMRSEEVQREISQVRNEVERLRTSYMRQEQDNRGFFSWLFGKKPQQ